MSKFMNALNTFYFRHWRKGLKKKIKDKGSKIYTNIFIDNIRKLRTNKQFSNHNSHTKTMKYLEFWIMRTLSIIFYRENLPERKCAGF